jgi:ribonuclease R
LFVELDETGADGLVPARHIGDEYFRFNEAGRAFVGRSATYRLGDPVTVELVEAVQVAGALRFKLVSGGNAAARPRTKHKTSPQPKTLQRAKRYGKRGRR